MDNTDELRHDLENFASMIKYLHQKYGIKTPDEALAIRARFLLGDRAPTAIRLVRTLIQTGDETLTAVMDDSHFNGNSDKVHVSTAKFGRARSRLKKILSERNFSNVMGGVFDELADRHGNILVGYLENYDWDNSDASNPA